MKANDLRNWIDSLSQDIDFSYKGVLGSICPINRQDIDLCFGDSFAHADSVDDAMKIPFIDGKSLNDVVEQLDI